MSTVVSTFWSKLVATCGTWTSVKRGVCTSPDLRFDHDDVISRNTVTSHLKSHQRYITYELADVSSYPLMYRYGDSVPYRWIYCVLHFLYPKFCVPHCGGCRGETCGNTKLPNMEDECKLCLIHTVTLQVLNNTSYLLNQCENDVYQLNLMKFEWLPHQISQIPTILKFLIHWFSLNFFEEYQLLSFLLYVNMEIEVDIIKKSRISTESGNPEWAESLEAHKKVSPRARGGAFFLVVL